MAAPCLIFAVGNESRGDDALGPLLLREIKRHLPDSSRFEFLEDFQLQVEHALDMTGRERVLFIDAGHGTPAPFRFYRAQPQAIGHSSHALPPEALLTVYSLIHHTAPPTVYVLCVRGECFELGDGLSPGAQAHYTAALDFIKTLLNHGDGNNWDGLCGGHQGTD